MTNEVQTLRTALDECLKQLAKAPQFQPLLSVQAQLEYLLGVAEGSITDRSKLDKIIIGVYAAREFESRDMDFANLLYQVEEIVDSMKSP